VADGAVPTDIVATRVRIAVLVVAVCQRHDPTRHHAIVVSATDLYGNTATASVDVKVANSRRRSVH
jgi:hypothetical protein